MPTPLAKCVRSLRAGVWLCMRAKITCMCWCRPRSSETYLRLSMPLSMDCVMLLWGAADRFGSSRGIPLCMLRYSRHGTSRYSQASFGIRTDTTKSARWRTNSMKSSVQTRSSRPKPFTSINRRSPSHLPMLQSSSPEQISRSLRVWCTPTVQHAIL